MKKLSQAILSIQPTAEFVVRGKTYTDIEWYTENPPTEAEVLTALAVIETLEYKEKRAKDYPSLGDQLDDIFKAGLFSEEMTAKIQAVKDKYPKPE